MSTLASGRIMVGEFHKKSGIRHQDLSGNQFTRSCTGRTRSRRVTLGLRHQSERIARLRTEHGITQTQLAERLGVSQQTIQAYESGKRHKQLAALPELPAFDHT